MSRTVHIRNVPESLHRKLKTRAASAGQTLSNYLLEAIKGLAHRPTRDKVVAKIHRRRPVRLKTPAAVLVREGREAPAARHRCIVA